MEDGNVNEKRTAVVTGAASGIGCAIAEALATAGVMVVVVDQHSEQGAAVAERIGGHFIRCDLARQEECRHLIDAVVRQFGGVDILVNNAGFQHIAPIEAFPEAEWDRMIAVMLTAPFLLTRYAWPHMKAQQWGRVVNIASIHGQVASPFKAGYVSAKHGLIGLTRTAALEGGANGITVNAICPAYVRTPLVENQIEAQAQSRGISADAVLQQVMLEPAAIKRLIEPAEVGAFVVYLCSDAAGAITGATLSIDLGWTAR
jgi:3-hydroxybutyrate dehydrogenase